ERSDALYLYFFFYCYADRRHLPSFPTRRSSDLFGATPCNVAQRLASSVEGSQVKVVAGVNVPMLWRSLCYADETLDMLVARAVAGATQGVMQVATSRPQNQAFKPGANDQSQHHHQQ